MDEDQAQVEVSATATPFLRWAGGKRWLVPKVRRWLAGTSIQNYHEPFVGGGAVFFGIDVTGKAFLSDLNAELVETYEAVRDEHELVAEHLHTWANSEEVYYAVRTDRPTTRAARAARFIYLNHHSFNGIYRVNRQGNYNVPYGRRPRLYSPSIESLGSAAAKLRGVSLASRDFEEHIADVAKGDLVFLDPPYATQDAGGFLKYNPVSFSWADQARLQKSLDSIRSKGAYFVLSNAKDSEIRALFETDKWQEVTVSVTRGNSIGGVNAPRGSVNEYIFTNLPGAIS